MSQEEKNNTNLPPRIALYGNPVLEQKAEKIDFDNDETELIENLIEMIATMYSYGGIGLAGPQIHIMKRLIVWDHQWMKENKKYKSLHVMINPEIINQSTEDIALYESCLSIPEVEGPVYRSKEITVRYVDGDMETKEETFRGLDARVIMHEIDHLDGILFVNQMIANERDSVAPFLVALRQAHKKYFEEGAGSDDSATS